MQRRILTNELKNITILMGKSFSGKSTFLEIHNEYDVVKTHTTRPKRETENGDEYYFEDSDDPSKQNQLAKRVYNTVQGPWAYWTSSEDIQNLENPILILDFKGTIELISGLYEEFGDIILNKITILYINTPLEELLYRAYNSERGKTEDINESVRRLLSDIKEFKKIDNILKNDPIKKGRINVENIVNVTQVMFDFFYEEEVINGYKKKSNT